MISPPSIDGGQWSGGAVTEWVTSAPVKICSIAIVPMKSSSRSRQSDSWIISKDLRGWLSERRRGGSERGTMKINISNPTTNDLRWLSDLLAGAAAEGTKEIGPVNVDLLRQILFEAIQCRQRQDDAKNDRFN